MNRTLSSILSVGIIVIGLTVWLTWPTAPRTPGDPSRYKFLHCPQCEREDRYTPAAAEKACLYCEKELVPTEQSIKDRGGRPSPYGRMFTLVAAELIALMALVLFLGRARWGDAADEYYYFNCGRCRQKIRYRIRQVGLAAICPRCKAAFTYPEVSEDEE
jgi:hypothetical protein